MEENLRAIVLDILLEDEKNPGHSNTIIKRELDSRKHLEKKQRAFISRLSEGTIEKRIEEDWLINHVSKITTDKMKPAIRNILRMSVYQIKYMDKVPARAVCNEAVRLASARGFNTLKGFINGVIRTLLRQLDSIEYPSADVDFVSYCMIRYSMPEFLVRHFIRELGDGCVPDADRGSKVCDAKTAGIVETVLKGFDSDKRLYIRCNTRLITPDELVKRLIDEGVEVSETIVPYAFEISGYDYIQALPSFNEGLFQIQDLSSILAGLAVNPRKGDFIVDVCAAPGGKCLHAAQRAEGIRVEARDISPEKIKLIEENIRRMKFSCVSTKVWNAEIADKTINGRVDILICDVPCSGLGILGRKADIRYNASLDKMTSLVHLQRSILKASSEYVKPGGYIIYSTCTINYDENLGNIKWFTENFPYEAVDMQSDYPMLRHDTLKDGYVQLLPGTDGTDGFFIAKLRRKQTERSMV